ncbi:hypothetical protein [Streptomyces sp. NPDC047108]|uniref:hypothetical protein n=1 Tax=Streptomyces sp. NPDC047108 TaxID=3155025 RepID=UPI0033D20320
MVKSRITSLLSGAVLAGGVALAMAGGGTASAAPSPGPGGEISTVEICSPLDPDPDCNCDDLEWTGYCYIEEHPGAATEAAGANRGHRAHP